MTIHETTREAPDAPTGPGVGAAISSEFIKLGSVPTQRALLLLAIGIAALMAVVFYVSLPVTQGRAVSDLAPEAILEVGILGVDAAAFVLVVLAAIHVGSDYSTGMIQPTLTITPSRGRVLAGKFVTVGVTSLAVGAIAAAVCVGAALIVGRHGWSRPESHSHRHGHPACARFHRHAGPLLSDRRVRGVRLPEHGPGDRRPSPHHGRGRARRLVRRRRQRSADSADAARRDPQPLWGGHRSRIHRDRRGNGVSPGLARHQHRGSSMAVPSARRLMSAPPRRKPGDALTFTEAARREQITTPTD